MKCTYDGGWCASITGRGSGRGDAGGGPPTLPPRFSCAYWGLSASGPEYSAIEVGFSAGFWVVVLGEAVEVGFSAGFWVVVLGEAVEVGFSAGFWVVVLGEAVEVGFSAGFWTGALGEVVLDFGNWSIQRKKKMEKNQTHV